MPSGSTGVVALREQRARAVVGERLAPPRSACTLTDSILLERVADDSERFPEMAWPAHSASPSCSSVSSAFSSANDRVCAGWAGWGRAAPPGMRNAVATLSGKAGNAAPSGTASTVSRRRRMRVHTASRSRSASPSSSSSSSVTTATRAAQQRAQRAPRRSAAGSRRGPSSEARPPEQTRVRLRTRSAPLRRAARVGVAR
jgi:hypothetical protein